MRDAGPGDARLIVGVHRIAVVRLEQVEVDLAQALRRDRAPVLDETVRLQLVVREQHLRVERADDAVDCVLEEHDALALIGRLRQHVVEEQRLGERGRHLRDEDRVGRIDERLMRVREERVHRVPHLVRQREDRVERVVVIQQHVRVHAVHRR